jgi:hypothetical protein
MVDDEEQTEFWSDGEIFSMEVDSSEYEQYIIHDEECIKVKRKSGCTCIKCGEFFPYAEWADEFKCWGCRH